MRTKLNLFIILNVLMLLASCQGQAKQQPVPSNNRVIGDTVPALGSNIMVVYQAKNSTYWFGSWETGVYRFDGKTFVNFTTKHGLPNNRIDEIKEDKLGNLYFSSCHPTATVIKFDGKTFTQLVATTSDAWKLQTDDLWFRSAYQSEKVYRYDGTVLHELSLPKPPKLTNPFEIYSIYKDRKGNLWFGTNPSGVCRYDGASFDWITEEDVTEFRAGGANGVRSITEDQQGAFWFNTEYRYIIYGNQAVNHQTFYHRQKSIGSLDGLKEGKLNEYLSITKDHQQNLWMATYRDGVWKYDGQEVTHFRVQHDSKDITIFSIYKDNEGHLWLGTHTHGAYKFNGTTFEKFIK